MKNSDMILWGAIGLGGIYLYSKRAAILAAFNPASDKNVANEITNSIVQSVTGDPNATLSSVVAPIPQNASGQYVVNATPSGFVSAIAQGPVGTGVTQAAIATIPGAAAIMTGTQVAESLYQKLRSWL